MQRRWVLVVALGMLMATEATGLGDWTSQLAKKGVGEAAQAGIENAVGDAAKDAAFDAALGAVPIGNRRLCNARELGRLPAQESSRR